MPDHGEADAGVRVKPLEWDEASILRLFKERWPHVDLTEDRDAWGRRKLMYPHVQSIYAGFKDAIEALSHQPAPVAANASAELSKFANDLAANQEPLGVQISAEDLESIYIRDEPSANASAELQNDLGEMLRALGMSDAAQPRSPHKVFQSAIAEMKRQMANASAEARLREAHIEVLRGLVDVCAHPVNDTGPDKTTGPHLINLLDVIERTPSMPIDKIARWTGFIQGVLCARGIIDVDAERDRTRPIFSAHTHASDCDKTTYDVLGDQRTCVGVPASGIAKMMDAVENPKQPNEALKKLMRDHANDCDKQGETTKSEGGEGSPQDGKVGGSEQPYSAGTRQGREIPQSSKPKAECAGSISAAPLPSDRTADVTGYLPIHECYETGDDEVTVVELKTFLDKQWPAPHGDVARAILGAFTVGRR